jgi:phosphoribosyl 1,2-cyclic phosphodiesterase
MRFATLGSGSRGNAVLVESGATRVLVDCGFGPREAERRLKALDASPAELSAILVTHEHADHARGVARLADRFGVEVWATPGTWREMGSGAIPNLRLFSGHGSGFRIGDLSIIPFPVPHDAREPCQFMLEGAGHRLGILTDAGRVTEHIRDLLRECDALLLECNHDVEMLRTGPYPPSLQARVGGNFGHLSNEQAADLLQSLPHARLSHLVAAHISEKNNRPSLAREALLRVSDDLMPRLTLADQQQPGPWLSL